MLTCLPSKLLPVCYPSVAGYKGIHVADTGNMLSGNMLLVAGNLLLVRATCGLNHHKNVVTITYLLGVTIVGNFRRLQCTVSK